LCCPHCTEPSLHVAQLATNLCLYRLMTGLSRVAGNANICRGQTTWLQKCFISVAKLLQFLFCFCSVSLVWTQPNTDSQQNYTYTTFTTKQNATTYIDMNINSNSCPSPHHEDMRGVWRYSSTHLILALNGGEWLTSSSGHFTPPPQERTPVPV
jgi:hypothetical protein